MTRRRSRICGQAASFDLVDSLPSVRLISIEQAKRSPEIAGENFKLPVTLKKMAPQCALPERLNKLQRGSGWILIVTRRFLRCYFPAQ